MQILLRNAPCLLVAGLVGCGWLLGTQNVEIQNDSDVTVVVVLGTLGTGQVAPHSRGVVSAEEGTKSDIIYIRGEGIPESFCQWDEVRDQMPIIVTNLGAEC